MNNIKFCPNCGSEIKQGDKFCGDCGFDLESYSKSLNTKNNIDNTDKFNKIVEESYPKKYEYYENTKNNNLHKDERKKNKRIIIFVLIALVCVGVFMILNNLDNKKENNITVEPTTDINNEKDKDDSISMDLTKATTYLSKPGIKVTSLVNYPNGISAIVQRVSGLIENNDKILVSEVELGIEYGEEYGYVFHYLENQDGTYYIFDDYPNKTYTLLKNNLEIGNSWNFVDDNGVMNWTVINMDIELDLGFNKFENCLVIKEENKTMGNVVITYYAPNYGTVYVTSPDGKIEYYKLTDIENISLEEASEIIIKWSQNHLEVGRN